MLGIGVGVGVVAEGVASFRFDGAGALQAATAARSTGAAYFMAFQLALSAPAPAHVDFPRRKAMLAGR
jgi:hypothetical protein